MMKPAYFVSEPVQHQGGVVADVMSASIATSAYSQAETFLRETLQNACDQRSSDSEQITFVVDVFQIAGKRKQLFDDFFANARLGLDPLRLTKLKESKSIEALIVADIGTIGLVGPLDASIDEKPSNFAGFFYNVGRQTSDERSGGSFGLGRTVLTNASDFSTILVYSQFLAKGKLGKRFMGMAIRGAFSQGNKRFTGRHWFGIKPQSESGLVEPYQDSDAEEIANAFGMKNYLGDNTGFVALVIGNSLIGTPDNVSASNKERLDTIKSIQRAACIYGWPHMLGTRKGRSVNFQFLLDGEEIPEEDPKNIPGLREFISCYEALESPVDGVEAKEILFTNATGKKESTGTLTWLNIPTTQSDRDLARNGLIPVSSIALMRQANFVVKYLDVTQKADQVSTRGVFKSNSNYDALFRKSEPVAHDDWIPAKLQLKPNQRNPIKQTIENIKETFKEIAGFKDEVKDGSASVVLGNVVGRLLDGLTLTGPAKPRNPGGVPSGTSGGGRSIQIIPIGTPRIHESTEQHYLAIFKFQVIFPKDLDTNTKILFNAFAILENGGPEFDPPAGASVPLITNISLDNNVYELSTPIQIIESMNMKIFEVSVTSPQGVGATCRWKVIE